MVYIKQRKTSAPPPHPHAKSLLILIFSLGRHMIWSLQVKWSRYNSFLLLEKGDRTDYSRNTVLTQYSSVFDSLVGTSVLFVLYLWWTLSVLSQSKSNKKSIKTQYTGSGVSIKAGYRRSTAAFRVSYRCLLRTRGKGPYSLFLVTATYSTISSRLWTKLLKPLHRQEVYLLPTG